MYDKLYRYIWRQKMSTVVDMIEIVNIQQNSSIYGFQ